MTPPRDAFPQLRESLPPFLDWIRTDALPFWGSAGVDWERGGFHERLGLDGRPIEQVPKRVMVQGRQLYVYCHAGLLGWYPDARRRRIEVAAMPGPQVVVQKREDRISDLEHFARAGQAVVPRKSQKREGIRVKVAGRVGDAAICRERKQETWFAVGAIE